MSKVSLFVRKAMALFEKTKSTLLKALTNGANSFLIVGADASSSTAELQNDDDFINFTTNRYVAEFLHLRLAYCCGGFLIPHCVCNY